MTHELVLLHLSDIHFNGRGLVDTFDLDVTLRNELERDATEYAKQLGGVSGLVVTGDLAYHATKEQFDTAVEWLAKLCHVLKCPEENVWTVPGNHDVHRAAIKDSQLLQDLHRNIRAAAPDELDETLNRYLVKDKEARLLLFRPIENYNRLAGRFGCDINPERPFWTDDLPLNDGSTLRLCGLNSTLVSDDLDDEEKLVVGAVQSERALLREDGVEYMVLCHHPLDWLLDHDAVDESLTALARVQLFGHKHSFRVLPVGDTLRLSSGAVHPNKREPAWEPRYNFLSILVSAKDSARALQVTVHPRIWKADTKSFQADFDQKGSACRSICLPIATPASTATETRPTNDAAIDLLVGEENQEMSTTPARTDQPDPNRRLVYRFLSLPYGQQIRIAQNLTLLHDEDTDLSPNTICRLVCKRAREGAQLESLWNAIEASHGVAPVRNNPFTGK